MLFGVLTREGAPIALAAVLAVLAGALAGAVNGLLVTRLGLPSLAVTIGTLALYRGIAVGCSAPPRSPTGPRPGPTP